ncbi:hypothetical protein AMECASPLE_019047 [Ameca splendens]|uniref:Replication factor A1 n=1 Tax=Ameca splendens TaxID=208324 RepID=A0ABV0XRX0_9TELE
MREATDVLWPHSILTPVAEIHNVKGLLTVEGNIVQLSAVSRVTTGREEVPLRHLKLEQEQAQVTLCLWREAAVESVEVGTKIRVTHVKLSSSAYGDQLQSTAYTEIEVIRINEESTVEVLGVTDSPQDGFAELLLSTNEQVVVDKSVWEPFEELLAKDRVFVRLMKNGVKVVKLESVHPPPES